jgi:hypothetical protein
MQKHVVVWVWAALVSIPLSWAGTLSLNWQTDKQPVS